MNPWEEISLSDYENHMSLKSVYQLQVLNELMREQIIDCNMETLAIMGIAGGNGLEYVKDSNVKIVYGIDVNRDYIEATKERHKYLGSKLNCLCLDVIKECEQLPEAEYIIANLFLEYATYDTFIKVLYQMKAKYVSYVIQVNGEGN